MLSNSLFINIKPLMLFECLTNHLFILLKKVYVYCSGDVDHTHLVKGLDYTLAKLLCDEL